jgi:hypothetical protein
MACGYAKFTGGRGGSIGAAASRQGQQRPGLKFAESLARGEPNRSKSALTELSDKVRELI